MAVTAIALWFTLKHHQRLEQFSESYLLESKLMLIDWILDKLLSFDPKTLKYASLAATLYAGLTMIEVMGLWYDKVWAETLVIVLVGMSIPLELLELLYGFSLTKLIVFIINASILGYLVHRFMVHRLEAMYRGRRLPKSNLGK